MSNVLRPMYDQKVLVVGEAAKKTFILPISQLDAVMISLDDAASPQSMLIVALFKGKTIL